MPSVFPSDVKTLLAELSDVYADLPRQTAEPLVGATAECEATLYGKTGFADETMFFYGYNVGAHEHCFLYDTPWDETHRALGGGDPPEWYDGLELPRAFRVRYSVSSPAQHEILDPLLKEMMKRPLRRLGTRPAVPHPLTASAEEILRDIELWDERLSYVRTRYSLEPANSPRVEDWTAATARFGGVVGSGDTQYAHYRFTVDGTEYVFALNISPTKMTPAYSFFGGSRKDRRAHLEEERRWVQAINSLTSGQELRVRFNRRVPGVHSLELPPLREGEAPPVLSWALMVYQLEPLTPSTFF